jgi:hypothetical protein
MGWSGWENAAHPGSLHLGGERIEWQALGRLRAGFAPQKQCNFFGCGSVYTVPGAECGMESGNGETGDGGREAAGGGARPILWNSYGLPMEFLWSNTPAAG